MDEDIGHLFRKTPKTDEANVTSLNIANRIYRKCVAGECPPIEDPFDYVLPVRPKKKSFNSKRYRDRQLSTVWKEVGRKHRLESLAKEIQELRTQVAVAESKVHVKAQEDNFKFIKEKLKEIDLLDESTNKANFEIGHLKTQIERVKLEKADLKRQQAADDDYEDELKKASSRLEKLKSRLCLSRRREGELAIECGKLRQWILDILVGRKIFNTYWSERVGKLRDRRKFLLDMIERANSAYIVGADILDDLRQAEARRMKSRNHHVSEMYKITGAIDANIMNSQFLGSKGQRRHMAPPEQRDVIRKENFKKEYGDKLDVYGGYIADIKKTLRIENNLKLRDYYVRTENDSFQCCNFLNEISLELDEFVKADAKTSPVVADMQEHHLWRLDDYNRRIIELNKKFALESENTLKAKNDLKNYEKTLGHQFETLIEIMKILKCDLTPIQSLLGDRNNINSYNLQKYFSILEERLNEVIAIVYLTQRNDRGLLDEDPKLMVKSLRRRNVAPIEIKDVIKAEQCAECAESRNVNLTDEDVTYPVDLETARAKMRVLVSDPEIKYRLHSLSECNLPQSVIACSRRGVD